MPRSSANWMMWLVESHPHVRMSSFFPPTSQLCQDSFFFKHRDIFHHVSFFFIMFLAGNPPAAADGNAIHWAGGFSGLSRPTISCDFGKKTKTTSLERSNPLKLSGKICWDWGFHFFLQILTWVYPRSLLGVTICCYTPWRVEFWKE